MTLLEGKLIVKLRAKVQSRPFKVNERVETGPRKSSRVIRSCDWEQSWA